MTLQAPEHLRGSLLRLPMNARQPVYDLIFARTREGFTQKQIGDALGLPQSTVNGILARHGVSKPSKGKPRKLCQIGIKIGEPGRAIEAMDAQSRDALIRSAAKTGKPMAAVLADFWAQHHGAQV